MMTTATTIDINCDMGESFGVYTLGMDTEVIHHISSANIACGFHAGDAQVMRKTVRLALAHGVAIGAHPGFPDLPGFGRRRLDCSFEAVQDCITYQVGALQAFCRAEGGRLHHVKPHGALYNMAAADPELLRAIARAVYAIDPELWLAIPAGPNAATLTAAAAGEGLRVVLEAFPDRAYEQDGSLRARDLEGAVIHDAATAAARALHMVERGTIATHDGAEIPIQARSLCVHGDNANAVALAAAIRERLESAGVTIAAA